MKTDNTFGTSSEVVHEAIRSFHEARLESKQYQGGIDVEKTLIDALARQTDRRMMGNQIDFHVPGAVIGKGRPRIGKVGSHARMFTPEKTVNFESFVAFNAHNAMLEARNSTIGVNLFYEAVQVNLLIGVQIPASWSKKKQAQALAGTIYPTTKPDLDNCIKSVFDAMNGVVYKDDSQVVTSVVKKRYREAPGLWCTVFAIGDNA